MAQVNYPAILNEAWQQHLAEREANAPTVISTFAGAGGSSLGYSMAGFRELLAVEWDNNAVETFKLNFPDIPVYHGDIAKLTVDKCLILAGIRSERLDILDGSPPCQGFSTAGKRQLDDDRNQLFREFVRLLRGLRPRVFVMENVSGMIKGRMKLIFAEIMQELKSSGYQVRCQLMNTKYFHVPQSRQRLIWIGVRNDLEPKSSFPKIQNRPIAVKDALCGISDTGKLLTPEAAKYWPILKPGESASKYHPKGHLFGLIKINPNMPSPTLTKFAGVSKHCHWTEPRFIGIKERARLGAFPDQFHFLGTWTDIYNCIGNSVPPLFMRAIASHIRTNILSQCIN